MKRNGVDAIAIFGGAAAAVLISSGCGDDIEIVHKKLNIIEAAEQKAEKYHLSDAHCGVRWATVAGLRDVLDLSSAREDVLEALGISSHTELFRLANEIRQSYTANACFVNTIIDKGQRLETHWEVGQPTIGPWGCVENKHPERCNPYQSLFNSTSILPLGK